MTTSDFRKLLDYHGLSQNAFARIASVNERLVRRWCDKKRVHPLSLGSEARIRQALSNYGNGISSE